MLELATQQPDFLGVELARDDALDSTVSYWKDLALTWEWRDHTEHKLAQQCSQNQWYHRYTFLIAKVERITEFDIDSAT